MTSGPAAAAEADVRVTGSAVVYRLYDVGYEIHLDTALDRLASSAPERVRPVRGEAQAIRIKNTPVTVILGGEQVSLPGARFDAVVSARIFDFGGVSLRLRIAAPAAASWSAFAAFGGQVHEGSTAIAEVLDHHLRLLVDRIAPAIERRAIAPVTEDYVVFRVDRLENARGEPLQTDAITEADLVALLLHERRTVSAQARRDLLPHRFSYHADDLAVVTWNNALVVEPMAADTDVQYVLEFANAQLLELRVYDQLLDEELPRMYDRAEAARKGPAVILRRRYAPLLAGLQSLVADSTELVERVENSLKVTDDVYLARIYSAALEIFRGKEWRQDIDRKLAIIRETYEMLSAEAQAARAEVLELSIVVLIVLEIVLSFLRP